MKIVHSSVFESIEYAIELHSDEAANPLVVLDEKVVRRVHGLLQILGCYWLERQRAPGL